MQSAGIVPSVAGIAGPRAFEGANRFPACVLRGGTCIAHSKRPEVHSLDKLWPPFARTLRS